MFELGESLIRTTPESLIPYRAIARCPLKDAGLKNEQPYLNFLKSIDEIDMETSKVRSGPH